MTYFGSLNCVSKFLGTLTDSAERDGVYLALLFEQLPSPKWHILHSKMFAIWDTLFGREVNEDIISRLLNGIVISFRRNEMKRIK